MVTNANGSSATSTILPPYEGTISFDNMGAEKVPAGYELAPQPTRVRLRPGPEDHLGLDRVDRRSQALHLARDGGVQRRGPRERGRRPRQPGHGRRHGHEPALFGLRPRRDFARTRTPSRPGVGYRHIHAARGADLIKTNQPPTVEPLTLPVRFTSVAGPSNESRVVYAGVPKLSAVVNPRTGAGSARLSRMWLLGTEVGLRDADRHQWRRLAPGRHARSPLSTTRPASRSAPSTTSRSRATARSRPSRWRRTRRSSTSRSAATPAAATTRAWTSSPCTRPAIPRSKASRRRAGQPTEATSSSSRGEPRLRRRCCLRQGGHLHDLERAGAIKLWDH